MIVDKVQAQKKLPSAIFIMGPTAAGKTDLAVSIAKDYPVEIISVDSALVEDVCQHIWQATPGLSQQTLEG